MENNFIYENNEIDSYPMKTKLTRSTERMFMNDISIENIITLKDEQFTYFKEHLNEDYNFIREQRDVLSKNNYYIPCLLVRGENSEDGVIVQTDESNLVEYYDYVPKVDDLVKRLNYELNERLQYTDVCFQAKEPEINRTRCKIEKIIGLSKHDFEEFSKHMMRDYHFIEENQEYMFVDENDVFHSLLVVGEEHDEGIIVESEGAKYARYSALFPNAKMFIKQNQLINLIEDIYDINLKKEANIKVLVIEPNKLPETRIIPNTLEAKQQIVGGPIELVELSETADLICNEEGKLNGLTPNRRLGNDVIVGTFLIVGNNGSEDFASLNEADIKKITQEFSKIEELKPEDVPEPQCCFIGFK